MKKNGFTLIELLAVITILSITIVIVAVKVDKNLKEANEFSDEQLIKVVEDAAYIYATEYSSELTNLNTINVDEVAISTLVSKGLIEEKGIKDLYFSNKVIIANINDTTKVKYVGLSNKPVIFLVGPSEISLYIGDTYNEMGAYVAVKNTGVSELSPSNISSNIDAYTVGKYEVTYTYTNATTQKRIVNIINK